MTNLPYGGQNTSAVVPLESPAQLYRGQAVTGVGAIVLGVMILVISLGGFQLAPSQMLFIVGVALVGVGVLGMLLSRRRTRGA